MTQILPSSDRIYTHRNYLRGVVNSMFSLLEKFLDVVLFRRWWLVQNCAACGGCEFGEHIVKLKRVSGWSMLFLDYSDTSFTGPFPSLQEGQRVAEVVIEQQQHIRAVTAIRQQRETWPEVRLERTEADKIILVWHACGVYGFQIPWANWMCYGVYPTCEADRACLYLISSQGQEGVDDRTTSEHFKNHFAFSDQFSGNALIDLDEMIEPNGSVHWDLVLQRVLAEAPRHERRLGEQPYDEHDII